MRGVVEAVSGLTVRSAAWGYLPDGWFAAGLASCGQGASRLILAHAGPVITLASAVPGLAVGQAVVAYAGCDRTFQTCQAKFCNGCISAAVPPPRKNPSPETPPYDRGLP